MRPSDRHRIIVEERLQQAARLLTSIERLGRGRVLTYREAVAVREIERVLAVYLPAIPTNGFPEREQDPGKATS